MNNLGKYFYNVITIIKRLKFKNDHLQLTMKTKRMFIILKVSIIIMPRMI